MSSTNDTYQHLFVQVQPKSILKKSLSPKTSESMNDNIEKNSINLPEIFFEKNTNSSRHDLLSTSDDELPVRHKIKSKKIYSRPLVVIETSSSSSLSTDNDERKNKQLIDESKTKTKHQHKDMQLEEFIRTYQQQGGISLINKDNRSSSSIKQPSSTNDTMSLIQSIDTLTLSNKSISPLQLLFNVACSKNIDRRMKINEIRQYIEEQIGISAFLTMYKLIKSSQISIDFKQKPFCYYENFIPHLCCLILLESEQQNR